MRTAQCCFTSKNRNHSSCDSGIYFTLGVFDCFMFLSIVLVLWSSMFGYNGSSIIALIEKSEDGYFCEGTIYS